VRITHSVTLSQIATIWTIEMKSRISPLPQTEKTEIEVETYPGHLNTTTHLENTILPTTKAIVEKRVRDHLERYGLSRLTGGLDDVAPGHYQAALERLQNLFPEFNLGR
jgi:hypothetical protein